MGAPHHEGLGGGLGAPHRGAGGLQLQDDSRGVLELAGGSVAAGVPVGGAALTPRSLGDPCFGLGSWAGAGGGQGLELGGGGGARGGLPTGAQLLLLLLDDELLLLLLLRRWLRLHRLRRLLQELGGLQRGIGCGDSDGDRDPPSPPALREPPPGSPSRRLLLTLDLFPLVPLDSQLCQLLGGAALRLSQGGGPQFWEPRQCSTPGSSIPWSPLAYTLTAPVPCTP